MLAYTIPAPISSLLLVAPKGNQLIVAGIDVSEALREFPIIINHRSKWKIAEANAGCQISGQHPIVVDRRDKSGAKNFYINGIRAVMMSGCTVPTDP